MAKENSPELIDFECPHCQGVFIVAINELNCRIARHFVFKTGEQLNPHASKEECDRVVREDMGYGCGKPVILSKNSGKWIAEKCGYI